MSGVGSKFPGFALTGVVSNDVKSAFQSAVRIAATAHAVARVPESTEGEELSAAAA